VLIDGRTLPSNSTVATEVCIVGAGAAGITLAIELAGQPFRVLVLESGGLDFEADSQSLYRGRNGPSLLPAGDLTPALLRGHDESLGWDVPTIC
jgi:2-polyprenyl-6-methoxyphenol hydroxylase-like FAD-dependent oxidoreductase